MEKEQNDVEDRKGYIDRRRGVPRVQAREQLPLLVMTKRLQRTDIHGSADQRTQHTLAHEGIGKCATTGCLWMKDGDVSEHSRQRCGHLLELSLSGRLSAMH